MNKTQIRIQQLKSWLASRARKEPPTGFVLHATAGDSATGAISWLKKIALSYHYIIDKDGTVYKCVPYSRVAFHAGRSYGWQGKDVNDYSIGICFVNRNDGTPLTEAQELAAKCLIRDIVDAMGLSNYWVASHYAVATPHGRKSDPKGVNIEQFVSGWAGRVYGQRVTPR